MFLALCIYLASVIGVAKADGITFTEVSIHHQPVIDWDWSSSHSSSYAAGWMEPLSTESEHWYVNGTRVTISFPNTPDPSAIGLGNWVAAGMFVEGMDGHGDFPTSRDWGYYAVLVLYYTGDLYLDVGMYRLEEWTGGRSDILVRTWHIGGVDHSTPITLTSMWLNGQYIDWFTTINQVDYDPPNSIFDMSGQDDPQPNFTVGVHDLGSIAEWTTYHKCYYFQFGITSLYPLIQAGWRAKLSRPSYNENNEWYLVQKALSIGGENAFLDAVWKWGGVNYQGVSAYSRPYEVTFYYSGDPIPDNIYLWLPAGGGGPYCPFVSVWNGSDYVTDNNVLPGSELSNGADVEDHYRLEQTLLPENGKYKLLLSEFESEHSYFDQAMLLAIDHNSDVNIAFTPTGEILTYKNPVAPLSAIDDNGTARLNEISVMDGNVSDPATYFQGYPGDYLTLNFGEVNSNTAKLIVRDDQKKADECILVQIMNGDGSWQTVETLVPRADWSMEAVNLSPYVVQGQDLWVRLYWKYRHRLDFVGLDMTPQDDYEIRYGNLVSATHSTQGDVKPLLLYSDNLYTELIPGQQIQLEFTLPNNQSPARTYVFYTKGHYYTIP